MSTRITGVLPPGFRIDGDRHSHGFIMAPKTNRHRTWEWLASRHLLSLRCYMYDEVYTHVYIYIYISYNMYTYICGYTWIFLLCEQTCAEIHQKNLKKFGRNFTYLEDSGRYI